MTVSRVYFFVFLVPFCHAEFISASQLLTLFSHSFFALLHPFANGHRLSAVFLIGIRKSLLLVTRHSLLVIYNLLFCFTPSVAASGKLFLHFAFSILHLYITSYFPVLTSQLYPYPIPHLLYPNFSPSANGHRLPLSPFNSINSINPIE